MTINELLKTVIKFKASDLHLVAGVPPVLRISGMLQKLKTKPLTEKETEAMALSIISKSEQERFFREKELDVAYALPDGGRFRVNIHLGKGVVGLSLRHVPKEIPTMDDLDLPEAAKKFTKLPHGLVLITGPTGCGKSTTLASMFEEINKTRAENIFSFEDPIEFEFIPDKSVFRQRQLGSDMVSFAEGLKHVLRQDPDVVMVGEMRDLETVATTLTLAETGCLVFATLHTYSAAQTIDRIIDVFPPHQQTQVRMQLALTLRGVISQQLVPAKKGGRVAVREILVNTPAVANLVREGKIQQINTVVQTGARLGMITLEQDIKRLIKDKVIEESVADEYLVK